jgi:Tol biopolymer transport system component
VAAAAFGAVALGFFVLAQGHERIAEARRLIAEAQHNVGQDPNLAIPLAIEAFTRAAAIDGPVARYLHSPFDTEKTEEMVLDARRVLYEAVHTKKSVRAIPPVTPVRHAAFSPDGSRLVTVDSPPGKSARIWDKASGAQLVELSGHSALVETAAFSPDGRFVATASHDRTAKLWDTQTGRELRTLWGHSQLLRDVAFSPDGNRLATASYDGTAKLWDTRSGRNTRTLRVEGQGELANRVVNAVAFSPYPPSSVDQQFLQSR